MRFKFYFLFCIVLNSSLLRAQEFDITDQSGQIRSASSNIDGTLSSAFTDNSGYVASSYRPEWIQTHSNSPYVITRYVVGSSLAFHTVCPKDWQLLGSNNGTSWTVLDSRSNEAWPGSHTNRNFNLSSSKGPYKYFRLNVTGSKDNKRYVISNFEIYGYVPKPSDDITIINECGSTTLRRNDSPPTGITWYWHSSSTGTSTSDTRDDSEYELTSGTVYYLRARDNSTGNWSENVVINYTVNSVPDVPPVPIATEYCGYTELTRSLPQSGYTYYWQTASDEESIINSDETITLTSSGTYYLRSRNNSTGCWSTAVGVSYSINDIPGSPLLATSEVSRCNTGPVTLSASPAPGSSTVRWYDYAEAGEVVFEGLEMNIASISADRTYYLTSYNTSTQCESATRTPYSVKVNQSELPAVSDESRCDDGAITLQATPGTGGDGVRWYDNQSDGTLLYEGNDYTISNLTESVTVYAATHSSVNGCEDDERVAVTAQHIAQPLQFDLKSEGVFCSMSEGGRILLENSEASVTYTLLLNGVPTGASKIGTGDKLIFSGIFDEGTYTIEGDRSGCITVMNGSISMTFSVTCTSLTVSDSNFEQALVDQAYDGGVDGIIYQEELAAVVELDLSNQSISDLSGIQAFTALTTLDVSNNQLTKLDVSTNSSLTSLNASNNPIEECIRVSQDQMDNHTGSWTKDAGVSFDPHCGETYVPDDAFEMKLINMGVDTHVGDFGLDNYVNTANISTVVELMARSSGISDLTGIEDFSSLELLDVSFNALQTLDLSQNTNLKQLYAGDNSLNTLILPNSLVEIQVNNNEISEFDLSTLDQLEILHCDENNLNTLLLPNSGSLKKLYARDNQLQSIDLSGLSSLESLVLSENQLDVIDVADLSGLLYLEISNNQLTELDLGANQNVDMVGASYNSLTKINVFGNTVLYDLNLRENQLTRLDVSTNTALNNLTVTLNENLDCIRVSESQATSIPGNWRKDESTSWDVYCQLTHIPDNNFEQALIDLGYDIELDGYVETDSISSITSLDVNNKNISNLTGISDFTALEVLDASQNQILDMLVVSSNHALTSLNLSDNTLTDIDLANNTLLESLDVSNNNLTSLSLINNTSITSINASNNKLFQLEVSHLTGLHTLDISSNEIGLCDLKLNDQLTTLNAINNPELGCIQVSASHFANKPVGWQIDATSKLDEYCGLTFVPDDAFEQALIDAELDDVADDFVNTANIEGLTELDLTGLTISDLSGIEEFIGLETLLLSGNALTTVNLSYNTALKTLHLDGNQLTALNLINQTALVELSAIGNQLDELDLSANTLLEKISLSENRLLELDLSVHTALKELYVSNNLLTTLDVSSKTSLFHLEAASNQIGDFIFTGVNTFIELDMSDNRLTDLLLSSQSGLKVLNCAKNELGSLDIVANTLLESLNCSENQLTSLDLSNSPQLTVMDTRYNPDQICIQVNQQQQDNIPADWQKDDQTTYSVFCELLDAVSTNQELWDQAYAERGSVIADDMTLRWNAETGQLEVMEGAGSYFTRDDQGNLIYSAGKLALGVNAIPHDDGYNYSLAVGGDIITSRLKVRNVGAWNWPDYVFEPGYNLRPLQEVEAYIAENKHLPEIPSAAEVEQNGLDVSDMNNLLLKKIEELTLYIIELKKESDSQKKMIQRLQQFID